MKCKKCQSVLENEASSLFLNFCNESCAHEYLIEHEDWLYVDRMGMYCDLTDDDPHPGNAMHNLDEAIRIQMERENAT